MIIETNDAEEFISNILYYELYYEKASIFFYALENQKTKDFLLSKISSLITRIPKNLLEKNEDFTDINPENILNKAIYYAEHDFSHGVYETTPLYLQEEDYYEFKLIEIPWMYLDPDYYILENNVNAYKLGQLLCQKKIENSLAIKDIV